MTVIACNLSTMASDTLWAAPDGGYYYAPKLLRLDDGSVIGGAGGSHETVMGWIQRGSNMLDLPSVPDDDWQVLRLQKDGIYIYNSIFTPWKLLEKNYAIGACPDLALYCMRVLRMLPARAAKECTKVNRMCGGSIEVLRLGGKK